MAETPQTNRTLVRIVLILLIIALGLGCYLLWRRSVITHRTEAAIDRAVEQIDQIAARVKRLEEKGAKALGVEDLEAQLDRMAELREEFNEPGSLDETGKAEVKHLPEQPGDVPLTCADIRRAQEELAYNPGVPIERGLELFVEWFEKKKRPRRKPV